MVGISTQRYKYKLFTVGAIGTFMATLDGSILNVALPTISSDLNCPVDVVAWVVLSYSLTLISLMMVFGAWSAVRGYSFSYRFGYSFFLVGSAVCALSGSISMLILGRVVQAIGTGMFAAVGPGMVTQVFDESERGKGIGMMVMMVAAGFMVGPVLGGFMLDIWPWQSVFIINIPVGLIGLAMTYRYFKAIPPTAPGQNLKLRGAIAVSVALVTATLCLSLINDYPLKDIRVWGLALVSLVALAAFGRFESNLTTALIGLDIFKNRQFTTSIGAMLFMFMSTSGVFILIPFYLERIKHFQPKQVGLYLIILPVLLFVLAPLAGRLSDRIGYRVLTVGGVAVLIGGLFLLSHLGLDSTNAYIVICLVVIGVGIGVFNTPNSSALMGSVKPEQRAVTSSILATTRNIGMTTGVALSTSLFAYYQFQYASAGGRQAFLSSYQIVIYVAMALAFVSLSFSVFRDKKKLSA